MAQKNKVSVATIEQVMKEQFGNDVKKVEWCGVEIEYKEVLTMVEMKAFVDGVVDASFDNDGDYMPEFTDWLIRTNMIQLYTNVRMPQNIEKQYDILYRTDLYEQIAGLVDQRQYAKIMDAIEQKLEYRRNSDVTAMRVQLSGLIQQFESMGQDLMQFTPEDVENLEGALEKMKEAGMDQPKDEPVEMEDGEGNVVTLYKDDE